MVKIVVNGQVYEVEDGVLVKIEVTTSTEDVPPMFARKVKTDITLDIYPPTRVIGDQK